MKMKLIFLFIFFNTIFLSLYSQSTLTFWTNDNRFLPIAVTYNGKYVGQVTEAYKSDPGCYASGCVTLTVRGTNNTWSATGKEGSKWSSHEYRYTANCTTRLLHGTPNTSGGSSGSGGYSGGGGSGGGSDPAAAIAVVAVAAVAVVGVVFAANDIYVNDVESGDYHGLAFGFKNTMSRNLDVELGANWIQHGKGWLYPGYLKTDYPYLNFSDGGKKKDVWSLDCNFVYNLLDRGEYDYRRYQPVFNPYIGIATSVILNDEDLKGRNSFGYIAGFSLGKRVKLHARYKWLKNFSYNRILVDQFEFGLSVTYKDGWKFGDN